MEINKAAQAASSGAPTAVQLEAINNLAKAHLTAQQVYVFSLRLCDNQVDRDFERFDSAALPGLAKLFIGKTGIVDHKWSSDKQVARIFQTEVVRENGAEFIKAWAYIRRGDANDEIIADIEAGIKKEVSVGCAMGRSVCSVCGSDYGSCGHRKGESYDGQLAVASVVVNRVKSGAFPNTDSGVIYQGGQFSPVASGRFAMVLAKGAAGSCTQAANAALSGNTNVSSLYFCQASSGVSGTVIGNHVFY